MKFYHMYRIDNHNLKDRCWIYMNTLRDKVDNKYKNLLYPTIKAQDR